jgi:VWFA-related protein
MDQNRLRVTLPFLVLFLCCSVLGPSRAPALPQVVQQSNAQAPPTSPEVIKAQANLVLVDAIATDKKGNYVHDLESKDFHVYEDNQEQKISSFVRTSDPNGPNAPAPKRYLVLFFDNSTMDVADQARARQAASQFIEKTASPDRLMAVADFGGTLRIAQNFTANTDRLKAVVGGVKFSAVNSNEPPQAGENVQVASAGEPVLVGAAADFGARNMLLAVRSLAKNLAKVPGRKTVVLFSSGFPLTPERQSELTATVDACNKANVAIYPLDVRGLFAPGPGNPVNTTPGSLRGPGAGLFPHLDALFASRILVLAHPAGWAQRPGGGGSGGGGVGGGGGGGGGRAGGGGGTGGGGVGGGGGTRGGSGGTRGGGTGTGGGSGRGGNTGGGTRGGTTGGGTRGGGGPATFGGPNRFTNNPLYQPRQLIPQIPESATTNQQVLYALANGTGGFPIFNTNDFLAGLDKIARELNEYYVVGYVPPEKSAEGGCHTIKLKVDRGGVGLRSRSGYCDVPGSDLLAGKTEGKALEAVAASAQPGTIQGSLQAAYFYTGPGVARVNVSLQVPGDAISFEKEKGRYSSAVNVLGVAYKLDGSVGGRFSDTVKLEFEKKEWKEFTKNPFSYQNTFDLASGKYRLKLVVATGGQGYAKYERPLTIDDYNGRDFQLSAVALSNKMQPVSELATQLDAALLEEKTPLVVQGVQLTPSPSGQFSREEKVGFYCEVYEPLLMGTGQPRVGISFHVVDKKTNTTVFDSGTMLVSELVQNGNPVIPVGKIVPVDKLPPGDYSLQVVARDDQNHISPVRTADFAVN